MPRKLTHVEKNTAGFWDVIPLPPLKFRRPKIERVVVPAAVRAATRAVRS